MKSFWSSRSRAQKGIMFGSAFLLILLIVGASIFASSPKMAPLYNNLSLQEVGQIKAELDTRGIAYELEAGGTTINVPNEQVDSLLVDLAAQGLPNTGNIDYSFFSDNTSWGMTDNEFDVIKVDAMQTELANLMKSVEGINDAQVMINKPKDPVFMSEKGQEASASIVINTKPGYQFEGNQIESLYRLVSKSMPNLPTDNIVIMNQNFEYFDLKNKNSFGNAETYTFQQNVKEDIERDIQRRVQQMLGMMIGTGKVIASVTADVDFTQEKRSEELVEPVDEENMEGLPVSVETITETYSGNPPEGGVAGTGDEDIANYPAEAEGNNGDYEMVKESINNEFSRIKKNIVESPYQVRDLGIQVAVDNTKGQTGENGEVQYLTQQEQNTVEEGVSSILNSIVTTTISDEYGEINPQEKVSIVFQEFNGQQPLTETPPSGIPTWMYVTGILLLLIIIGLVWLLVKRSRANDEREEVVEETTEHVITVPGIEERPETESSLRMKQLEKLADEKPEDFAKLLRSWIAED